LRATSRIDAHPKIRGLPTALSMSAATSAPVNNAALIYEPRRRYNRRAIVD
jgi:hypothetical protein